MESNSVLNEIFKPLDQALPEAAYIQTINLQGSLIPFFCVRLSHYFYCLL